MTPQLWIAFGFLAALVVFLMITFLKKYTASPSQYNTLRLLQALCAGFAGGFFTGDALFRWDQQMADGRMSMRSMSMGSMVHYRADSLLGRRTANGSKGGKR